MGPLGSTTRLSRGLHDLRSGPRSPRPLLVFTRPRPSPVRTPPLALGPTQLSQDDLVWTPTPAYPQGGNFQGGLRDAFQA